MKRSAFLLLAAGCLLLSNPSMSRAQLLPHPPPGDTKIGFSRDVVGTLRIASTNPAGCATLVCSTQLVPHVECIITNPQPVLVCYTNTYPHLSCTTNLVTEVRCRTNFIATVDCQTNGTGGVTCTTNIVPTLACYTNTFPRLSCTNIPITVVRCETNIIGTRVCTTNLVPRLVCTNDFGPNPPAVKIRAEASGAMTVNPDCDELGNLLPSNTVFTAVFYANLRRPDWRGLHNGYFRIAAGTNTVATGSLLGSNGVGSHGTLEDCARCAHFEGTLRGSVVLPGPLRGAVIQATYAGDLPEVVCPSTDLPQGAVTITVDGVVLSTVCPPVIGP